MSNPNVNYGDKIPNATSYVKQINNAISYRNINKKEPTTTAYVKTILPSKSNGSFVKTFNNYY